MKIVVISNLFPPYMRGGAERIAADVSCALARAGHEVVVITSGPKKSGARKYSVEQDRYEGLKVFRFYPQNLYFTLDDFKQSYLIRLIWHILDAFNTYSAAVVGKILKKEKPDLVITHNLKGLGLLIPWRIRRLGLKQIHVLHDVQLVEPSGLIMAMRESWLGARIIQRLSTFVTRRLFKSPYLVVSPTEWLKNFYASRGFFLESKWLILMNPVEVDSREVAVSVPPRFVFVGQMEEHKGIQTLLKAFREVKQSASFQAALDVVGDGTLLERLQAEYGLLAGVTFHGRLPKEKVNNLLLGATALVFPSECLENAPGAVLESLALHVPVMASDVGGVSELVCENKSGWLLPAGQVDRWALELRRVAEHPKEVETLKTALRNFQFKNPDAYARELIESIQT